MAKGIKAAPKKRRRKRLSEHARLVEERARSIPPRVVHELFDTSTLPVPPPAPHRAPAPARFISKPPPPPPRPSHPPEDGEEAELEDLEGTEDIDELEELDELEEVDGTEESQSDGFGSHTISPSTAPEPPSRGAARGRSRRSRVVTALVGVGLVGALALVTGRELGRSSSVTPRVEAKPVSLAPSPAPDAVAPARGPVADDLPRLPPVPLAEGDGELTAQAVPAATAKGDAPEAEPRSLAAAASPAGSVNTVPAAVSAELPPFDVSVADAAIRGAFQRAQGCRSAGDPQGSATVTLTYAPSGRVTTALVSGVFAGTSIGSCIAAALRSARIPPFTGALVTVKRTAPFE
jgi:hypothetical protein